MSRFVALALVAVSSACANGGHAAGDAQGGGDGRRGDSHDHDDADKHDGSGSGSDAQPAGPSHLLLSEICLGPNGSEFVEIVNPTTSTVDLSQYYLSNHGSYFKLPAGSPSLPFDHFIVQFPSGATIAASGIITIATESASYFQSAFGVSPTYSIYDGTMKTIDGDQFSAHLTDSGAIVILFEWDGSTALVRDVDMMLAGTPDSTNQLISKSGYTQMGVAYATDANSIPQSLATPPLGKSTKRMSLEGNHETQAGVGNGLTGHDETSEATNLTWDAPSFTSPTPGTAPAAIL